MEKIIAHRALQTTFHSYITAGVFKQFECYLVSFEGEYKVGANFITVACCMHSNKVGTRGAYVLKDILKLRQ